ncbi:MAG: SMC-Scp complex subunit ScpB [Terracidiphilus sp.]
MSLKAKLEAAIYAAEEPVTLTQLAALFADDAMEWKAARESTAGTETSAAEGEASPLLNAEIEDSQLESPSELATEPVESGALEAAPGASEGATTEAAPVAASQTGSAGEPGSEPGSEPESQRELLADTGPDSNLDASLNADRDAANPAGAEPATETAADPEAEAKRLARARDREVRAILSEILAELVADYASDDRGIEIKEIAGGFRMATKPECHDAARMFVKSLKPALKLSLPALETLAVIAYKQPVTAPEVNEIRGVDSSGVFGSLLARKLIATAGRKQVIGRPILYKTTKEFLLRFGLKDVTELPSMEEFEKMAQLEFDEMEPGTEASSASEASETPEVDDEPDEQAYGADGTADVKKAAEIHEPNAGEPITDTTAAQAESRSADAAPAAPESAQEQAETETVPHG